MNDFAQNFLAATSIYAKNENLVFSPLSLHSALAMLGLEMIQSMRLEIIFYNNV